MLRGRPGRIAGGRLEAWAAPHTAPGTSWCPGAVTQARHGAVFSNLAKGSRWEARAQVGVAQMQPPPHVAAARQLAQAHGQHAQQARHAQHADEPSGEQDVVVFFGVIDILQVRALWASGMLWCHHILQVLACAGAELDPALKAKHKGAAPAPSCMS